MAAALQLADPIFEYLEYVLARFDYTGEPGDISFKKGDKIKVLDQTGEWWKGDINGEQGWFPANYTAKDEDLSEREIVCTVHGEQRWVRDPMAARAGTFDKVWFEEEKTTGKLRAAKEIKKRSLLGVIDRDKELESTVAIGKSEELFVRLLNWYEDDDTLFLATECYELGGLNGNLALITEEDDIKTIALQCLRALHILHAAGMVHGDIKAEVNVSAFQ